MGDQRTFEKLTASEMLCPRCRRLTPTRERLLLVTPGKGELHELVCAVCGEPVGKRTVEGDGTTDGGIIVI